MAGTWLDDTGDVTHNNYVPVRDVRAYDEGHCLVCLLNYQERSKIFIRPAAGTPENVLWATGWTDAHGAGNGTGGTVDSSSTYRGKTAAA